MTVNSFWQYRLLVIGILLFIVLCAWISYFVVFVPFTTQPPEAGGPEVRAIDTEMPVKEFRAIIDQAKEIVATRYRTANWYRWGSRTCDWVGFGFTSLITVIVGATGRVLQPGQDPNVAIGSHEIKLQRLWMRRVGVIAALASIMIGIASRLQSESQSALENGEKIRAAIASARKDFNDASTSDDAQNVIDSLQAVIAKC